MPMNQSYKSYTERVATITPSVIGYRLNPFSLGHSLLLKACGSKFVTGEYNGLCDINNIVTTLLTDTNLVTEFVLAVLICSTTYDEFKEECSSGKIHETIKATKDTINGLYLLNEIHTFTHYIKQGTNAPLYEVKENKDEVKTNPVEPEEAILSTLMTECGYTRNECLNLAMTETLSAYLLYAHKVGGIELISKEVAELTAKLKGTQ